VGLDIDGRSAEEIVLSILAGVVTAAAGRDGGWSDRRWATLTRSRGR
jgi:xanthine/CO dehydrogenase XdhC/CoxF family maturation factor